MQFFVSRVPGYMEDWYPGLDVLFQVSVLSTIVVYDMPLLNVFYYLTLFGVSCSLRARHGYSYWNLSEYGGYAPSISDGRLLTWCWDHG